MIDRQELIQVINRHTMHWLGREAQRALADDILALKGSGPDATAQGQVEEGHQQQHPAGDQGREAAEAGDRDRAPEGRQEPPTLIDGGTFFHDGPRRRR